MKLFNKNDYKVSLEIDTGAYADKIGTDKIYLVPSNKNYNSIKPKSDFDDNKKAFVLIHSKSNYDGMLHIYSDGTFSQYRDGCFYPYTGKVAV